MISRRSNSRTCFTSGARGNHRVVTPIPASPIEYKIKNLSFRQEQIIDGKNKEKMQEYRNIQYISCILYIVNIVKLYIVIKIELKNIKRSK